MNSKGSIPPPLHQYQRLRRVLASFLYLKFNKKFDYTILSGY